MVEIAQCMDFVATTTNNNLPPYECGFITVGFLIGLIIGLTVPYIISKLYDVLLKPKTTKVEDVR